MIDSTGAVYYYLNDHLGSAAVVINSSGTVRDKHKYQAFGGSDGGSVVLGQAYRYTGKPLDEELGHRAVNGGPAGGFPPPRSNLRRL